MDSEEGDEQKNLKSAEWVVYRKTATKINAISAGRSSIPGIQLLESILWAAPLVFVLLGASPFSQ